MCIKAKYILQKSTPKIKQSAVKLTISQFFQKIKSRSINKQILNPPLGLVVEHFASFHFVVAIVEHGTPVLTKDWQSHHLLYCFVTNIVTCRIHSVNH
jgi:hypothetical protein